MNHMQLVNQYIGDCIIKNMIKSTYPTATKVTPLSTAELTYEETNGLRYATEYVVKSLQKKAFEATSLQRDNIQLCQSQLVQADAEAEDDLQNLIQSIDRGGLCHVNNDVYGLFLALEKELRKHISLNKLSDMTPELRKELK